MLQRWPVSAPALEESGVAAAMTELQALVTAVRNVRNLVSLADGQQVAAVIACPTQAASARIRSHMEFLSDRANLLDGGLTIGVAAAKPPASVTTVVGAYKVHVPLSGMVDLGKLKDQLTKRAGQLEKSITAKQGRLGSADYIARAPAAQVAETRALLAAEEVELGNVRDSIAGLG
jgi:valyl-tRNA synthetase